MAEHGVALTWYDELVMFDLLCGMSKAQEYGPAQEERHFRDHHTADQHESIEPHGKHRQVLDVNGQVVEKSTVNGKKLHVDHVAIRPKNSTSDSYRFILCYVGSGAFLYVCVCNFSAKKQTWNTYRL